MSSRTLHTTRAVVSPPPGGRIDQVDGNVGAEPTRFYVRGHIDHTAMPELRFDFANAVLGAASDVVLDCSEMTFIDSSGIQQLVELNETLRANGRRFEITAISAEVAHAIDRLGLTATLRIEEFLPTEETAVVS